MKQSLAKMAIFLCALAMTVPSVAQVRDDDGVYVIKSKGKKKMTEQEILLMYAEMKKAFTPIDGNWVFENVVQAPGYTKDQIYNALFETMNQAYRDSRDVISEKDRSTGVIIGKGITGAVVGSDWLQVTTDQCQQHFTVEARDGRYRIVITIDRVYIDKKSVWDGRKISDSSYALGDFYPLWKECKPKYRERSFNHLRFAYQSAIDMMSLIQGGVTSRLKAANNNW